MSEPTEDELQQLAEVKAQLAPVIDSVLLEAMRSSNAMMAKVADSEIMRCIEMVQAIRIKDSVPPNLVGWNQAVDFIALRLQEWREMAAQP